MFTYTSPRRSLPASRRKGFRGRLQAGWTLVELMVVMIILGFLIKFALPELLESINRGKDSKASELQHNLQDWYNTWTHAGGTHDNPGSGAAGITKALVDHACSAPSVAGIARAGAADWVDERTMLVNNNSLAGSMRLQLKSTYVADPGGVMVDGQWRVVFTPTARNRGTWTVTVVP